jgi:alkylation response protein AidB-like acyl-CoA dehydrogenase
MGRGITEPNAGSDNRMPPPDAPKAGFRLRAERDGDEWVLNGEKCFIANGSVGSLFFVDARTNPEVNVRQGGTLFMVPKTTPGFRVGKVFNKRGWRFYQNAELIFENARIPHANVVGQVNSGAKASLGDTTGGDIFGDLELAANAVGVCDDAIQMAMNFAKTHRRAGRLVMEHQIVQLKLNEMHALNEALRSYVMRVAWERDQGGPVGANAGLAMNLSTDIIQRVTRLNMDIHGPEGCMMNARVDKLVRDAMVWTHLAGDTVQRVKILKRLEGAQTPSAGAH